MGYVWCEGLLIFMCTIVLAYQLSVRRINDGVGTLRSGCNKSTRDILPNVNFHGATLVTNITTTSMHILIVIYISHIILSVMRIFLLRCCVWRGHDIK